MFLRKLLRRKLLPQEEYQLLTQFEKKLGYTFKNIKLLKRALSHKSYANERRLQQIDHNERLEFLGDAVLELGISDLLMKYFPESREGIMSKVRASLVNETALAEQARNLDLGDYIFLGKGEDQGDGREKNSLLSDALEAVLGAVYQDSNFHTAYKIVKQIFESEVERATNEDITRDYKTKLQEVSQNIYKVAPDYRLAAESGPDHDKTFEIHLYIKEEKFGVGTGKSKKQAEQSAAEKTLEIIDNLSDGNS